MSEVCDRAGFEDDVKPSRAEASLAEYLPTPLCVCSTRAVDARTADMPRQVPMTVGGLAHSLTFSPLGFQLRHGTRGMYNSRVLQA